MNWIYKWGLVFCLFISACSGLPVKKAHLSEPAVVLIDIDDLSIKRYGQWPWSRSVIADLVTQINKAGAKVIALDMLLCDPDRCDPEGDMMLGYTLSQYKNVFVNMAFLASPIGDKPDFRAVMELPSFALKMKPAPNWRRAGDALLPIPPVSKNCLLASPTILLDKNGRVTSTPLVFNFMGNIYPSTALAVSSHYLGIPKEKIGVNKKGNLMLGYKEIPVSPEGDIRLQFAPPYSRFRHYSAGIVLDESSEKLKSCFKDKIVVVGASALGLGDHHVTPVSNYFPGPEILATAIQTILDI